MVAISEETPIFATKKPLMKPVMTPVNRQPTMATTSESTELPEAW